MISIILVSILITSVTCVYLDSNKMVSEYLRNVTCAHTIQFSASCSTNKCARRVMDDIFSVDDINQLHTIARKGFSQRESIGGPSILDINTG
jgi:hypothetical protein